MIQPKAAMVPGRASALDATDVSEAYQRHADDVLRWAARLGGREVDAEDVLHEVFLKVQRDLPRFRGDARLSTWLFRITRNVVGHRRRRERFQRWLRGRPPELSADVPRRLPSPSEALEHRQDTARLQRVLDRMSERYRTVLVLFELEKLSGEEISEVMGGRVSTVWVWIHRARAQFRRELRRLDDEEMR